jgi:hypothetical protein
MQAPLTLDYIIRLIHDGSLDEARSGLSSILESDPTNAVAWSLMAWVAPDSAVCDAALRKVIELAQDIRLRQWATRGLVLVENIGTLDEEAPPALGGAARSVAPEPRRAPAPAPVRPSGPKPRRAGYDVIQAGGLVMISGILVLALAIISAPFAALFDRLPVSAGTCGMGFIAIGAVIAYVGYQRK